jgi:hypothetical protein
MSLIHVLQIWIAEMMVCAFGGASQKTSPDLGVFVAFQSSEKRSEKRSNSLLAQPPSSSFLFSNICSRCNVFDSCLAESDCGDDGAPLVAHLQLFVAFQSAQSAAELFSTTKQLICILKHGLTMQ